jgi:ABC-type glycerol-3-phosphate transport system permease component
MGYKIKHLKESNSDIAFHIINSIFLLLAFLVIALPLINVIAQSFSSPRSVIAGHVWLWPIGFSADAYKQIFQSTMLITGYRNSFFYTIIGTLVNIAMTVMAAYPLSVKKFVGRNLFMALFVFTMIFSAPLIPTYLNIRNLHMLDTIWVMVIPGAISVYNMVIARTYFQNGIPGEMIEAAELDGASDIQVLFRLILPLSKSVLAVLVLYYAVGHWNAYFDAFIYLNSESKFPLQVVLRNVMSSASSIEQMVNPSAEQSMRYANIEVLKYAIIVFGSIPIVCLYPFVQKYFVKGVMIGSLKG